VDNKFKIPECREREVFLGPLNRSQTPPLVHGNVQPPPRFIFCLSRIKILLPSEGRLEQTQQPPCFHSNFVFSPSYPGLGTFLGNFAGSRMLKTVLFFLGNSLFGGKNQNVLGLLPRLQHPQGETSERGIVVWVFTFPPCNLFLKEIFYVLLP